MARAVPGQNQEPGALTRSHIHVAGTQALLSCFVALPGTFTSEMDQECLLVGQVPTWDVSIAVSGLT